MMDKHLEIEQIKLIKLSDVFKLFNDEYPSDLSFKICCPFPDHDDSTPSFKVYEETNSFCCFGCRKAGGPLEYVKFKKNQSTSQAISFFKSRFEIRQSSKLSSFIASVFTKKENKKIPQIVARETIRPINTILSKFSTLKLLPEDFYLMCHITESYSIHIEELEVVYIKGFISEQDFFDSCDKAKRELIDTYASLGARALKEKKINAKFEINKAE